MSAERIQYRNLTMLLFAPSLLSLYAEPAGSGRAVPHNDAEALRNSGGEAVLNGPMFEKCDPSAPYATQVCGVVDYKHVDATGGANFASRYPSRGMTISVMPDGSVTAASGSTSAPGARVAVQLYPSLVVAGAPQTVADQTFNYVVAVGVMLDGRMAFVVGRNLSLPNFAQQLADAGMRYGGYLDGGDSASLSSLSGYVGSSEHRRVLTWLVARHPGMSVSGSSGLAIAAVLALVAGVGWWWHVRHDVKSFRGMPLPRSNPLAGGHRYWKPGSIDVGKLRGDLFGGEPRENPSTQIRFKETTSRGKKLRLAFLSDPNGEWGLNVRDDGVVHLSRENRKTMQHESYRFEIRDGRLDAASGIEIGEEMGRAPFHVYVLADEMFNALQATR